MYGVGGVGWGVGVGVGLGLGLGIWCGLRKGYIRLYLACFEADGERVEGRGVGKGEPGFTLHAFRLVECTLMAGNKFWKSAVASFKCSSPPKLFITTSGAVCSHGHKYLILHIQSVTGSTSSDTSTMMQLLLQHW